MIFKKIQIVPGKLSETRYILKYMNSLAGEKDNQGNFESLDSKTQLPYIISTNQKGKSKLFRNLP